MHKRNILKQALRYNTAYVQNPERLYNCKEIAIYVSRVIKGKEEWEKIQFLFHSEN